MKIVLKIIIQVHIYVYINVLVLLYKKNINILRKICHNLKIIYLLWFYINQIKKLNIFNHNLYTYKIKNNRNIYKFHFEEEYVL